MPVQEPGPRQPHLTNTRGLPHRHSVVGFGEYTKHGAPAAGQPKVLWHRRALTDVAVHSVSDLESEVGGVLLGHAYRYGDDVVVEITAALPAESDDHGPIHFTFNADAWAEIHRAKNTSHPDLEIVGWFHTHPDLGVFFSADDVVVHSAAFVQPWHVALVVDPIRREAAMFGWTNGELQPFGGFFAAGPADASAESIPWRVVSARVWDESYVEWLERSEERRPHGARPVASSEPEAVGPFTSGIVSLLPPLSPWYAIAVAGVALMLSVVLLLAGYLPLDRRAANLEAALIMSSESSLAAASADGTAICPLPSVRLITPAAGQLLPVGMSIAIIGTSNLPEADSYRVEIRPKGEDTWWTVAEYQGDVVTEFLADWDTVDYAPGDYDLRLMALDGDLEPVSTDSLCSIPVTLYATSP